MCTEVFEDSTERDFYSHGMESKKPVDEGLHHVAATATDRVAACSSSKETQLIWAGSEGQLVNFWPFVVAVLFCWLLVPVFWAIYRYVRAAHHRYELTDQRLLEYSGIVVQQIETLELYRVKDIAVSGNFLQAMFGRGRVILQTTDASTPIVVLNAITNPQAVSQLLRDAVERCRAAKGVMAYHY